MAYKIVNITLYLSFMLSRTLSYLMKLGLIVLGLIFTHKLNIKWGLEGIFPFLTLLLSLLLTIQCRIFISLLFMIIEFEYFKLLVKSLKVHQKLKLFNTHIKNYEIRK